MNYVWLETYKACLSQTIFYSFMSTTVCYVNYCLKSPGIVFYNMVCQRNSTLSNKFSYLNFLFLFQFGKDKDLYGPRFAKNLKTTFMQLYKCPEDEKVECTPVYHKSSIKPSLSTKPPL